MRLTWVDFIFAPIFNALGKQLPKCDKCKKKMIKKENPSLFLIPVTFANTYTPSKEYYLRNCKPIAHVSDIPTGQRACRFWELVCPSCGQKQILVEDFLRVRDAESVENRNLYSLSDLADLLQS